MTPMYPALQAERMCPKLGMEAYILVVFQAGRAVQLGAVRLPNCLCACAHSGVGALSHVPPLPRPPQRLPAPLSIPLPSKPTARCGG